MSPQVVEEHKGLQEGLPTATALEELLCSKDPLLLVTGAQCGGFPVAQAPAWLALTVGGLVLEEAVAVHNIFTTLPACDGFLPTVLLVLARVCTE